MKLIEAVFRITTPMFISGSDQRDAEFRVPSLLGALRFWYRATAPANLKQETAALFKAESKLFGSSDLGQGVFLARVDTSGAHKYLFNLSELENGDKCKWKDQGSGYLGYGPILYSTNWRSLAIKRNYIREGSELKVTLFFRQEDVDESSRQGLFRALKALGLYGGLGSRSRRGFGSMSLMSLQDETGAKWIRPGSKEQLCEAMRSFLKEIGSEDYKDLPSFTAFSRDSKVVIAQSDRDPLKLLDEIGRTMIRYRSYGQRNNSDGVHYLPWKDAAGKKERADSQFVDDHDLVYKLLDSREEIKKHPRRVAFGLPHSYFLNKRQNITISGRSVNRRGSPLLIHIHCLGDKEYAAVLTYLPAQFLPKDELILMDVKKIRRVSVQYDDNACSSVIPDFLERFPGRLEVWP